MTDPLLSICCIAYNQEKFIRQTLDGFVMQKTNFKFEVLINDDCSTDGTADIIREYETNYPDLIKPLYHDRNQYSQGFPVNMNNVSRAKGKYIALCEGDDYWIDPQKLQVQVDFLESHPDFSLTYTDYKIYFEGRHVFQPNVYWRDNFLHPTFRLHLIHTMYLAPCTWVYRVSDAPVLEHRYIDDTYVMMLNFLAEKKVMYIDRVTAVYRISDESASHTESLKKRYEFLNAIIDIQDEIMAKYNSSKELVNEVHYHMYNRIFKLALAYGDFSNIVKYRKFWEQNKLRNCSDRVYFLCSFIPHILHPLFHLGYSIKHSSI